MELLVETLHHLPGQAHQPGDASSTDSAALPLGFRNPPGRTPENQGPQSTGSHPIGFVNRSGSSSPSRGISISIMAYFRRSVQPPSGNPDPYVFAIEKLWLLHSEPPAP